MKQLLVTIAYKIQSENKVFWKSPSMFYVVTIRGGKVFITDEVIFSEDDVRASAHRDKVDVTTYLEKLIMKNPELLEYCKLNRHGYKRNPELVSKEPYVTSQEIESERWKRFITKILEKKSPRTKSTPHRRRP